VKFISLGRVWDRLFGSKWYPFSQILHGHTAYQTTQKLNAVLQSPAVLKVFALQCDLFSMGKVTVEDDNGKPIDNDPFLALIRDPNPFTNTKSQFLWNFMFFNMLGTAYCYVDSKVVDKKGNKMYFLEPHKIDWPESFKRYRDKLIFSDAEVAALNKTNINYRYDDGSILQFPFDRLVISFDLTNAVGCFYAGPSRLDALYKIISNSEHTLDSENINIRYTGKFIVGADSKVGQLPGLGQEEKEGIVANMEDGGKSVYPVRSKPTISQFVENLAQLQLDKQYLHQYFLIGNMYGIPRDVLEAYNSATYENQEKARAAHVNYCLEPKGNQFMDAYEVHFKYRQEGKNIKITWKDLPFMQVFAKERAETKKIQVEIMSALLKEGVSIEQVNEFLDTEFEIDESKRQPAVQPGQTQGGQGQVIDTEEGEGEAAEPESDNPKMRRIV
jgi:hypothetical protein